MKVLKTAIRAKVVVVATDTLNKSRRMRVSDLSQLSIVKGVLFKLMKQDRDLLVRQDAIPNETKDEKEEEEKDKGRHQCQGLVELLQKGRINLFLACLHHRLEKGHRKDEGED